MNFFYFCTNELFLLLLMPLIFYFLFSLGLLHRKGEATVASLIIFSYSAYIFYVYKNSTIFTSAISYQLSSFLGLNLTFGIDGISAVFIVLSTLVFLVCFLAVSPAIANSSSLFSSLFLLEFFVLGVFLSLDLLIFFFFFEAVLVPMFIIIKGWGSFKYKTVAAYIFLLYTLFGGIFFLLFIIFSWSLTGSTSIIDLYSANLDKLLPQPWLFWFGIFFTFGLKTALVPIHVWLPWAHGEAPTVGSMVLAGILLKLGGYGFVRVLLLLLPQTSELLSPLVVFICLMGVLFSSFMVFFQTDLKRLVAYSSITHMGFSTVALFTNTPEGLAGSLYTMLAHGVVASALFFSVGSLYERYGTREIFYFRGVATLMPIFATFFFFFFMLGNASFPGTASFVGEMLGLIGISRYNSLFSLFLTFFLVLNTCYTFWAMTRICFGPISPLKSFSDISRRETSVFLILFTTMLWMGFFPGPLLTVLEPAVSIIVR